MSIPTGPSRQGTSRVVPVVVSAGLAIGVFCGLLFGLGTSKTTSADPMKGSAKHDEAAVDPTKTGSAGSASAATGSASAATGSAATTAASEPAMSKLTIAIKPDSVIPNALVFVDNQQIPTTSTTVAFDSGVTKKKVKVRVQVAGYDDATQDVEVVAGEPITASFELRKTPAVTSSGGDASSSGGGRPGNTGATGTGGTGGSTGAGKAGSGTGTSTGTGKGSGKPPKKPGLIDI